jgi:hypothetical protein
MTTLNNFPLHSLYGGWKKTLVNKRATVGAHRVCSSVVCSDSTHHFNSLHPSHGESLGICKTQSECENKIKAIYFA